MTTNNDLNVGLARLMGWHGIDATPRPDWAGSLDALFAPGGPVEYARNKHYDVFLDWSDGGDVWEARVVMRPRGPFEAYSADPAEALATALHEAFMKEQGQ